MGHFVEIIRKNTQHATAYLSYPMKYSHTFHTRVEFFGLCRINRLVLTGSIFKHFVHDSNPPDLAKKCILDTWALFLVIIWLKLSILWKSKVKIRNILLHTFHTQWSRRILFIPALNSLAYPRINRLVLTGQYLNIV